MLKAMRESSQSFLIYILFGMLVFVFAVSFGPGSGSCGQSGADYAAIVDGDIIRRHEFGTNYQARMNYMRRLGAFGGRANEEFLQNQMRQQVIDELIETRLVSHAADRIGLTVSDKELLKYLKDRYGVDQVDYTDYEAWVSRAFNTTVAKFETRARGEIVARTLQRVIRDSVAISDDELKETYVREHDRAMVTFMRFDPQAVEVEPPNDGEVEALLEKEPEAVRETFDQDLFKYRTKKQVQARHILKRLPADKSAADVAKARGELLELKSQLDGGADFVALAKEVSEDEATKEKGGDLGRIGRGDMAPALVDKLFTMKTDEVTKEPVMSPDGLHLLQVTAIHPPTKKPFAEVKREVAIELLGNRQRETKAKIEAELLVASLKAGEDLEALTWNAEEERTKRDVAEAAGIKLTDRLPVRQDSPWIPQHGKGLPGIGSHEELREGIFAASEDAPLVDGVFKVGRLYYVVRLKEREIADLKEFEDQKETLREQALTTKRNDVFRAWIKHLRKNAKVMLNPEVFPAAADNQDAPAAS